MMKNRVIYQLVMLILGFIASWSTGSAQSSMTPGTRFAITTISKEYKTSEGKSIRWSQLVDQYPIYKSKGVYHVSFLAKKSSLFNRELLLERGIEIGSEIGNIITMRAPVDVLPELFNLPGLSYLEVAGKVAPDLNRVLFDTRVDSIHKGINLPEIYTGKDVLIGITDWGFDYTNPMFYDTLLTQTRILSAWDQYKLSGPNPAAYPYGTEYNGSTELLAAQSDTANIYSYATHGSHVAGIAGGSGAGTIYRGMAFESEFLMVTIRIDLASILDAYSWMKAKADAEGKRLVVNMSWGLYHIGTLDGNSLVSQAIDQLSTDGVVFCNSGGNNGDVNFHIKKDFNADSLKSKVSFYTYSFATMWGQSLTMWGETNHSFGSKIVLMDAANIPVAATPMFYTNVDTNYVDSMLIVGADTIWYSVEAMNAHPLNQRCHTRFRVKNKTSYKTVLVAYADSGTVHFWNVVELINGAGNWGQTFTSLGAGYTAGDNLYGISEPAVTKSLITVAAHLAEFINGLGNLVGGSGASFSSRGPTIDGRIKPDISAPGANVCSSISSFTDNSYTQVTSVSFNSRNYPFAKFSGTSMSSPATAGVVALILDANPLLTPQEIKDILLTTAREDSYTGDLPDSGNTQWGHGKLNAYYAIALALNIVNVNAYKDQHILVFPNPTQDLLYLISDATELFDGELFIYSVDGKLMKTCPYQMNAAIEVRDLPNGIYLLKLISATQSFTSRFVKTH
jgi:subtilisin family serine protease